LSAIVEETASDYTGAIKTYHINWNFTGPT